MMQQQGQIVLFKMTKELAEEWNRRTENGTLPGDIFVTAKEGETYPALVVAVRDEKTHLKLWPIGGGALNVVIPTNKE